jgi:hypothetical protein
VARSAQGPHFDADHEGMRSTNHAQRAVQENAQAADSERHSVVTPLFKPEVLTRRAAVVRFGAMSKAKRAFAVVGSLALLSGTAWLLHQNHNHRRASERLAVGCLDVSDCRAVVQNVETLQDACWFDCSHLATLAQQARTQFRLALEQQAEREQAARDKDYQSALHNRQSVEEEHTKLSRAARIAEREHEHRLELERLAAQTERLRAARASAEGAQLQYFKQLSPEQRINRLHACHKRGQSCEDLVQQLSQAAPSLSEQRALVVAHEEYVTTDPAQLAQNKAAPGAAAAISESSVAQRL